jgi:glutamate/aspartate transport system substrate-binding protein
MNRFAAIALSALFLAGSAHAQAVNGRLKKILDTKTIAIAYRPDASPFSFLDEQQQPTGYSIDLCKAVVRSIEAENRAKLEIRWVPVTIQNRFDAVAGGEADMECSTSTVTLSRMKQVDFSSFIFLESTGVLVRSGAGARSLEDLKGRKIAVLADTTNARVVNDQLQRRGLSAAVLAFKTREEAFAALEAGKVDAFASDKLLLVGAAAKSREPGSLTMLPDDLSFEPYGIALPRGDAAFRLAVNSALARLYPSDEMGRIFKRWFGTLGRPSGVLAAVYIFGSIPE